MAEDISTALEGQIARLVVADMDPELPGTLPQVWRFDPDAEEFHADDEPPPGLTEADISELLSAASLLALSADASDRTWAYEIVTRVLRRERSSSSSAYSAAELIFTRLGNLPGRVLLRRRYRKQGESTEDLSPYLSLEMVARQLENTVEMPSGREVELTDFQLDLFDELQDWPSASVSAPTSSGKSFVLSLDIARKLQAGEPASIVYVVPTRALIRQVTRKINEVLRQEGLANLPVRTVPFPVTPAQAPQGVVYVLTQERLVSLLNSDEGEPWITTLIVDEAQGIGDGARGILLHSAADAVIARFPNVEVFFASPLAKNPEYLLEVFERTHAAPPLIEEHSPVSQNVILVKAVRGDSDRIDCHVIVNGKRTYLGERIVGFQFGGATKLPRRARFAVEITGEGESTIVYANWPSHTETLAQEIARLVGDNAGAMDPAVARLVDFLREHIHEDYGLINVLRKGVAFHYGAMPSIVRSAVEDLVEAGLIRFVCCTSTLLQGVNLPARHIVIEDPSRGSGRRMERRDFLNLAGRAGRLLKEFHGNVWCLEAQSWEKKSYEGEPLQPLTSAFEETLEDGGSLIGEVIDGTVSDDQRDVATAALGKVFSEFTLEGKPLSESKYRTQENQQKLREIEILCTGIKVDLPAQVFRRNATLLPMYLQELYEFLRHQDDILQWVPLPPYEQLSQMRLKQIFSVVQRLLGRNQSESYEFHAWLAGEWIRETPLRELIAARISTLKSKNRFTTVDDAISKLMDAIETDLRYEYTKNLRAYNDVLAFVLSQRGRSELAASLPPLHIYIECGASHRTVLNLIALGLSRTTAILLRRVPTIAAAVTVDESLRALRNLDVSSLRLPGICAAEVEGMYPSGAKGRR